MREGDGWELVGGNVGFGFREVRGMEDGEGIKRWKEEGKGRDKGNEGEKVEGGEENDKLGEEVRGGGDGKGWEGKEEGEWWEGFDVGGERGDDGDVGGMDRLIKVRRKNKERGGGERVGNDVD